MLNYILFLNSIKLFTRKVKEAFSLIPGSNNCRLVVTVIQKTIEVFKTYLLMLFISIIIYT